MTEANAVNAIVRPSAEMFLVQLSFGALVSQALYVAAKLKIADLLSEKGKALIIETIVPEGNEPHFSKLIDLEMLVSAGGLERTEREYGELLAKAGLRLTRIVPTQSAYSVIEAIKA